MLISDALYGIIVLKFIIRGNLPVFGTAASVNVFHSSFD